jgi:hypothetical protein
MKWTPAVTRHAIALALLIAWPGLAQAAPQADFAAPAVSDQARIKAGWVVGNDDAKGLPFLIVDKREARVFAFDPRGLLLRSAPALIGLAPGDVSPPGIGSKRLAEITPDQRITPAGRFEAALGKNLAGHTILWVDYDSALSLHRVVTTNRAERRLQRLETPSPGDNRVSYGCINVPAAFYDEVVEPLFSHADGIVYILPRRTAADRARPKAALDRQGLAEREFARGR